MVPAERLVLIHCFRVPFSTNVERIALAAGYKGVSIEWADVDPNDRSRVVAASGQPLVPVLLADDEVVVDSPRILLWLEERFPEPSLLPADRARRAEVLTFVDWFNHDWKRLPNALTTGGRRRGARGPRRRHRPFHAVVVELMQLVAGSPLHAWIARVDARPRG